MNGLKDGESGCHRTFLDVSWKDEESDQPMASTRVFHGGWLAFDSSTGFRLPDGSVLSPDASLVDLERWQALSAEERRGFAPCARRWWPVCGMAPGWAGC